MPSFDIVSEIDQHEVTNAVDQANRELTTRFDFKGTNAEYTLKDNKISLKATNEFQLKQMIDILYTKFTKRSIDVRSLSAGTPSVNLSEARQEVTVKQGIEQEDAKKIIKLIKDAKLKVQTAINGDKVRTTGKNRDDLQEVIALVRQHDFNLPLQYINFRD
jgi:uncharacterized protein YajQ (UPF0234 family)